MKSNVFSLGRVFVATTVVAVAVPEVKRPSLRFTTETRYPGLIGVTELTPSGTPAPALLRYFRRLSFSGERKKATGPLVGKTGECPGVPGSEGIQPEQRRTQVRGQIDYVYDPLLDGGRVVHGATQHQAVLLERPWPAESCNPPPSPLPLGLTVPETGTAIPYGIGISPNNPLGLPVITAQLAADPDAASYVDFLGDGIRYYPTHSRDAFRMILSEEDTPEIAESRAHVTRIPHETVVNRQSSIFGSRADGPRWTIREVGVLETLDACPGEYAVIRRYQRRPLGAETWSDMPSEHAWVKVTSTRHVVSYTMPKERGHEIRLVGVTYEAMSGDCGGCGAHGAPAGSGAAPTAGSVAWNLSLGTLSTGDRAGVLSVYAPRVTSALYRPDTLRAFVAEGAELLRKRTGEVSHVLTPYELAKVVITGLDAYEVRFYHRADIGMPDSSGEYAPVAAPYLYWRAENPTPGIPGRWKVTRFMGGQSLVTEFDDTQPDRQLLSEANGLRITETRHATVGLDREETITLRNAAGEIASKRRVLIRAFPWGEEKVKEVLDPDGAALTTEWSFDAAAGERGHGRALSVRHPDGSVRTMLYDGATGEVVQETRPVWRDSVTGTRFERVQIDLDGDGVQDRLTTAFEGSDPFTRFGLSFTVEWGTIGRRDRLRAVDPSAVWNSPSNIRTRERFEVAGPFAGELTYRLNPDTTLLVRGLAGATGGGKVVTEDEGASDPARERVIDGTRTVQTFSARGELLTRLVTDIATGRILETTQVLGLDPHGRPLRVQFPDGAIETRTYCDSCGGLESSTRRGEKTTYLYDALNRRTDEVRTVGAAVLSHTRSAYDAAGRVVRQLRVDPATGGETVLRSTTYDLAGRVTAEFTLGRGTTTYAYAFAPPNLTVTTTTYSDGGTIIESRAPSGEIVSVRGTAAPHVDYHWTPREWWGGGIGYTSSVRRPNEDGSTVNEDYSINFLGDVEHVTFGDGARAHSYYDSIGRLVREVDPDGVTLLHAYDARGRRHVSAIDMNRNGVIDYSGPDRIVRTRETVGEREGTVVRQVVAEVWATDGVDLPTEVSREESAVDGRRSWHIREGLTTRTEGVFDDAAGGVVTTTLPDGTIFEERTFAGRSISSEARHPSLGLIEGITRTYDAVGRVRTVTHTQTGVVTFTYDIHDRLETVESPDPDPARSGPGYDSQVTRYGYDIRGRVARVTHPDNTDVFTTYFPSNAVRRTWGARTYPVEYAYDRQGRMTSMTTWQDFAGDAGRAVTTWKYDLVRGWVAGKAHADGKGPAYLYTSAGRMRSRIWARGLVTNFGYNNAGELASTDYADSTPDVALTYDRLGRLAARLDGSGACSYLYEGASERITAEAYSAGDLNGLRLQRTFDSLQRLSTVAVGSTHTVTYGYDAASRLLSVGQGARTATYSYLPASGLVDRVDFRDSGTLRFATTRSYDQVNRINSVRHVLAGPGGTAYSYDYNAANQRTRVTREEGSSWRFGFDSLGQLITAGRFLPDGTRTLGHDFAWSFDDIGNRKTSALNGRISVVSSNLANQPLQRSVPGVIEVLGAAATDARVAVVVGATGVLAQRQGELYLGQVVVDNTTAPVQQQATIAAVRPGVGAAGEDIAASTIRPAFLPRGTEVYVHDDDGKWSYSWDGENRLRAMETLAEARAVGAARTRVEFSYDAQSRRTRKFATQYALAGLVGEKEEFFPNVTLTGAPSAIRRDGNVDSFWAAEPVVGFPGDNWSYRVTAVLRVPTSGPWTFTANHRGDDGMRLFIDDRLVLDRWIDPEAPANVVLNLESGREYSFRYEFHDRGNASLSQLRWSGPGVTEQVVPNAAGSALAPVVSETRFLHEGMNQHAE